MSRSELLAAQRWSRRHATQALFGRTRAYARGQGPAPGAGVLAGLLLAAVVWAAPLLVDVVRTGGAPSPGQQLPPPAPASAGR
ncbi:hypothetical protein [Nocardioides jishulii]|uniref:Uncharacterized protein n=1 Tax=Nocardioides jishulii TaxID=2575440 RepID=A0A4U2YS56_9ACTN|nr:hypothetical protein [Nocardioides jishulii]QCX28845.1 hypothetical protein FCL41_15930 [Nocardioides jishulii]TKI64258.1 hypothetical protein FC770_03635 [Nocardioides jishulii]